MSNSDLALLGGRPICPELLQRPDWPPVSKNTADRLRDVYLARTWSFNSPAEQEFAQAFADYHDAKHGIFMANGTVTLHCALAACGIVPGDEVIVPALTWIATAMAIHYVGATPVFVDIEPETLCLDPHKVKTAITDKTKGIIPVHLYGSMADMEAILSIASEHKLAVIEDCAHMHGGKWNGQGVGSLGDVGSFSFQQSKTMSSGEGGICITNDDELAEKIFRIKHIGYLPDTEQGQASQEPEPGLVCHNFRGTAFQAVILSDQLKELKRRIDDYNEMVLKIQKRLNDVPGVRIQTKGRLAGPQGYYCFVLVFDEPPIANVPIEYIQKALYAEGLKAGPTYGPVYKHALFNLLPTSYRIAECGCPVAETTGTQRSLVLAHQWLTSDKKTIGTLCDIIAKVALNAKELMTKYNNGD